MHSVPILIALSCWAAMAVAQGQQQTTGETDPMAGLLLPIKDAPLSVDVVVMTEKRQAEGKFDKQTNTGKVYRDSAGRTRVVSSFLMQPIYDPVAGFQFMLIEQLKLAIRVKLPPPEPSQRLGFGFLGAGSELMLEPGEKTHQHEDLGTQTIEGIEFHGSRTITTMVAEPAEVGIDDHWISQELGLIAIIQNSSPMRKLTVKIQNLIREEPDPSVFLVPPEYTIRDSETLRK